MRSMAAVCTILAVTAAGCAPSTEGVLGAELYEQTCSVCHRADGGGFGNWPPIGPGSNAVVLTDDQIAGGVIRAGAGVMPSFPRLTDAQVESLVVHVRRLQGTG